MMKYRISRYRGSDSMAALICDNYQMLIVMNRFGIPLGVGEHTIEEVCRDSGVDLNTFLAVVNLLIRQDEVECRPADSISLDQLIDYLLNSHKYYTEYRLPAIRCKLVEAVSGDQVSELIITYFDQYAKKICDHLSYEESVVFPYICALCSGEAQGEYSIDVFSRSHDHVEEPLEELKNIIIKYYQGESNNDLILVLHDILSCANDLSSHNLIEDNLLVPIVKQLEDGE